MSFFSPKIIQGTMVVDLWCCPWTSPPVHHRCTSAPWLNLQWKSHRRWEELWKRMITIRPRAAVGGGGGGVIWPRAAETAVAVRMFPGRSFRSTLLMKIGLDATVYPQRPGQKECKFYIQNGVCKFREKCKFHHPIDRTAHSLSVKEANQQGVNLILPGLPRSEVISVIRKEFDHVKDELKHDENTEITGLRAVEFFSHSRTVGELTYGSLSYAGKRKEECTLILKAYDPKLSEKATKRVENALGINAENLLSVDLISCDASETLMVEVYPKFDDYFLVWANQHEEMINKQEWWITNIKKLLKTLMQLENKKRYCGGLADGAKVGVLESELYLVDEPEEATVENFREKIAEDMKDFSDFLEQKCNVFIDRMDDWVLFLRLLKTPGIRYVQIIDHPVLKKPHQWCFMLENLSNELKGRQVLENNDFASNLELIFQEHYGEHVEWSKNITIQSFKDVYNFEATNTYSRTATHLFKYLTNLVNDQHQCALTIGETEVLSLEDLGIEINKAFPGFFSMLFYARIKTLNPDALSPPLV